MKARTIKSEREYEKALERMNEMFHSPKDSPEQEEAELLMLLIEKYEQEHQPIEAPDPIEAIKFRMEQLGI